MPTVHATSRSILLSSPLALSPYYRAWTKTSVNTPRSTGRHFKVALLRANDACEPAQLGCDLATTGGGRVTSATRFLETTESVSRGITQ